MELSGDVLIRARREQVWLGLNDSATLSRCIPGCETISERTPTERDVTVKVKVGPVRARFAGQIRMENVESGVGCTLHFEGSGGAAGMARGQSSVSLSDEADGTRLRYTAQASVGGKLGQVGGRMIDAAAKQMADQFFTAFEKELSEPAPATGLAGQDAGTGTGTGIQAQPDEVGAPGTSANAEPQVVARHLTQTPPALANLERLRIVWFVLGALSTGFGVLIAHWISQ